MDPSMVVPLRLNALALLACGLIFLILRLRLAKRVAMVETKEALPPGEVLS